MTKKGWSGSENDTLRIDESAHTHMTFFSDLGELISRAFDFCQRRSREFRICDHVSDGGLIPRTGLPLHAGRSARCISGLMRLMQLMQVTRVERFGRIDLLNLSARIF